MSEGCLKLIVGLGNPGSKYNLTRHNLGFLVLDELANRFSLKFKRSERFNAEIASGEIENQKVYLLKPQTYMNLSGLSVKKCVDFYKIKKPGILVVADDAALEFDEAKLKPKGGSGGHNGHKSIEGHIGSDYARLKMGIGESKTRALEDHVLTSFSDSELRLLGTFLDRGVAAILQWLNEGLEKTMNQVNTNNKKL